MRLAIVRQIYNPFGGAERFVERALAALEEAGLDITLVARRWQGEAGARSMLQIDPPWRGRLGRDRGFAHAVQALIDSREFDLVQSHERIAGCDIFRAGDGVHATWLEKRAALLSPPGRLAQRLSPWHRYTLQAEAAMFRHPRLRAVICNSRMVADDIAQRFGLAPDKLHVIYNGVDLDRFHPALREAHRAELRQSLGVKADAQVVLHVGSGFARKGLDALLAACAALSPDTELWVVGTDKHQPRYERLARQLGLGRRVRFFGGRQDVRPFYGAADVFALPTLYDPFPNAALEALACGLPLVTSHDCGAAERVVEGLNGHVCPARDVPALTARIADSLDRAQAMRSAARQSVEDLSLNAMAARLQRLYAALLAGSAQGG